MAKVSTNISIDAEIKAKAQELFADFGMDLSTAINVFLRQAIRENAIPFSVYREEPNEETIRAMREVEDMEKHPERYKGYSNVKCMMEDILSEI